METNGISSDEVENEAQNEICCLIEDGAKCRRPAGNASFSKRIQKTVQRKLKLSLDSFVSCASISPKIFPLTQWKFSTGQTRFSIHLWLPQVENSMCTFEETEVDEALRRLRWFRPRRLWAARSRFLLAAGSDASKVQEILQSEHTSRHEQSAARRLNQFSLPDHTGQRKRNVDVFYLQC